MTITSKDKLSMCRQIELDYLQLFETID